MAGRNGDEEFPRAEQCRDVSMPVITVVEINEVKSSVKHWSNTYFFCKFCIAKSPVVLPTLYMRAWQGEGVGVALRGRIW